MEQLGGGGVWFSVAAAAAATTTTTTTTIAAVASKSFPGISEEVMATKPRDLGIGCGEVGGWE